MRQFFVTLWEQLQTRAKANEDQSNLAGGMSYDHVKDRISSVVGTEDDTGVLFDETISAYAMRRKRAQEFLTQVLIQNQKKAFAAYLKRPQWSTISDEPTSGEAYYQLAPTAELGEPLTVSIHLNQGYKHSLTETQVLKRDLDFLSHALGTAVFRRIWREALEELNNMLWSDVLMANKFAASGAAQFRRDVDAISSVVERYIPDGSIALESIKEALHLLNLPVEAPEENSNTMTLKNAVDRVFTDNTEAKKVLEELDIECLSPPHARQILQRRVENAE